jgi:hypothetical protein
MTLSEIQDIAVPAVRACAAATNHPRKEYLRERLYDALRPVANLRSVDDAMYSGSFPLFASADSGVGRHSAMPNRKFAQQHRVHAC